jgi:hypothetical protein
MGDIVDEAIIEVRRNGIGSPRFKDLMKSAGAMGLPVKEMLENRLEGEMLDVLSRQFRGSGRLTRSMVFSSLRDIYPEFFPRPEVLPLKRYEPPPRPDTPSLLEELGVVEEAR